VKTVGGGITPTDEINAPVLTPSASGSGAARESLARGDAARDETGFYSALWELHPVTPAGRRPASKGAATADLIAIGYPDETMALSAMDEAERLQHELVIQTDAVAAIVRTKEGKIRTFTNHQAVGDGAAWGVF
jgi:hypothetical protein